MLYLGIRTPSVAFAVTGCLVIFVSVLNLNLCAMKFHNLTAVSLWVLMLFSCSGTAGDEPLRDVVERGYDVATRQALMMARELEPLEGALPRTVEEDGTLATAEYHAWISGFFPGVLWYLYEHAPSDELKSYAELYTARVEPAKNQTNTHDLGFMLYCSFGNGYRLTGNPRYLEVMETGARSLTTRYDPGVGLIRSWDSFREQWQYAVIIDNMMNLEFLSFIARETGRDEYMEMAVSHADKTLEHHFRPDNSSFHVVSYDTVTGLPHVKNTHQGLDDSSAWARGQAWALYGYTMMYRETGDRAYLEKARDVAAFLMSHPRMPEDLVPYWDFDDPGIPDVPRDASSAAIMASALIELSELDDSPEAVRYLDYAVVQVRSLSSPGYLAEPGTNGGFILKHSTGNLPGGSEIDVPLTYADYYYVEALGRLKKYILTGGRE